MLKANRKDLFINCTFCRRYKTLASKKEKSSINHIEPVEEQAEIPFEDYLV